MYFGDLASILDLTHHRTCMRLDLVALLVILIALLLTVLYTTPTVLLNLIGFDKYLVTLLYTYMSMLISGRHGPQTDHTLFSVSLSQRSLILFSSVPVT